MKKIFEQIFKRKKKVIASNTSVSFSYSSPGVQCTISNVQLPPVVISLEDTLIQDIIERIDKKSVSDSAFREWLRDNLSSRKIHAQGNIYQYSKPDSNIQKISVLDAMLEQGNQNDSYWC